MKKNLFYITGAFFFSLILFVISPEAAAAQKKSIEFDDFIRIKRVSDPRISPDGKWIAYVVTVMDKEKNRGDSDIWLVSAKGGPSRRLTSHPGPDSNPRWSPDGRKIAFISARSGTPQVWTINPSG